MGGEIVTRKEEAEERKNKCWEAVCESVPGTDELQSQEVLVAIMTHGTRAISNGSYNAGYIQGGGGGYMVTKITGLHMHLQKQINFPSVDPEATGTSVRASVSEKSSEVSFPFPTE